jgi:methylmalonyl-CoA/ethylmalonyl-CoA epimerase
MTSPAPGIGIARLGQVSVNAHDLERATNFYRDTLGLRHLFSAGKMAFFDCAGVRLMVSLPEKAEFDHPGSILYFSVADIKAAHRQLLAQGVHFEAEPHIVARMPASDLWMAFFRDSEDTLLALMSEAPHQA